MHTLKLAFYKGKGRFLDRSIKWWTNGQFSHVEILFTDLIFSDIPAVEEYCISSSAWDGGVRRKTIEFDKDKWEFISFPVSADMTELLDWLYKDEMGKRYDYRGILGFLVTPFRSRVQNKKKWYCSEICAEFLRRANPTLYKRLPHAISPSMLYAWVKSINEANLIF